jgi:DNA primase
MLRAARVAAGRKLELRVVAMPEGSDPADVVAAGGPEAMTGAIERSVPFPRFRVERVLAAADLGTAEGKDRALEELAPVMATLPPSAMREELTRVISDRMDLPVTLVAPLLQGGRAPAPAAPDPGGGRPAQRPRLGRREQTERTFLALCIALPDRGRAALERVDLDEHFTSDPLRRAAAHLRVHLDAPTEGIPAEDPELARVVAELAVRAAHEPARPTTLEVETLQLELARVDRQIAAARGDQGGEGGAVASLASRRAELQAQFDEAIDKAMEAAGSGVE